MTRIRLSGALSALCLATLAWGGSTPARAQDPRGSVAPPSSRAQPQAPALRDPTRLPGWRRNLTGSLTGVTLPQLRLRGRVVSKRGAVALLEIDGRLQLVRPGDQISLQIAGGTPVQGRRSGARRGAQPASPRGLRNLTLRVVKLDAKTFEVELVELSQTLTLR